jgi:tetratricopeptide (TPR) repeat protein
MFKSDQAMVKGWYETEPQRILAQAYTNKGKSLAILNRFDESIECYNKALSICKKCNINGTFQYKIMLNKGIALGEYCMDEEAILIFDEIINNLDKLDYETK